MSESIKTAAVIGSGVMGAAIAAQFAGAGVPTLLLDVVARGAGASDGHAARSRVASEGLARALKAKPALFFTNDAERLITVGNLEDDLAKLTACDLVIEAIVENLAVKQELFQRIAPHIGSNAVLASNTSGLSIGAMSQALPEALRSRFAVMHFFNPVRYMHLVEVAGSAVTSPDTIARVARFGEYLGKGIVYTKDTTNFVANRIGVHGILHTIRAMETHGLSIEAVDAIVAKPLARSAGAVFKTADIVGLDTLVHVAKNCYDSLPNDPERDIFKIPDLIAKLVEQGRLGRKSEAGFYKKAGDDILVIDPKTLEYRAQEKVRFDSVGAVRTLEDPAARLKGLIAGQDAAARFAWDVVSRTLAYAANCVGEIADDILNIDRAMRWGFNWELGPFESWDALGVAATTERMQASGLKLPGWVLELAKSGGSFYRGGVVQPEFFQKSRYVPVPAQPKELLLARTKSDERRVVKKNFGASLVDIGDGVLCVEVHTKMNTIDADVITMLNAGVAEAEKNFAALLVANDGVHFGAGANLFMIFAGAQAKQWGQIEGVISGLQQALQGLRYARVPVVAAPFQYTLGGGAELAMAADALQAHAETYMGLVELGVGLIPAGGGCLRMVERFTEPLASIDGADLLPAIGQASLNIALAKVSTSAEEARSLRYLLPSDGVTLNRAHLLHDAKQRALGLAHSGYRPPRPRLLRAAGQDAAATIGARIWGMVEGRHASPYDAHLARKVAYVLCGGNVAAGTVLTEQQYLDLERETFLGLCGEEKTLARIEHMLKQNKPLRN
jgi:3-hydroxyacyl-CoA dehydrogenase